MVNLEERPDEPILFAKKNHGRTFIGLSERRVTRYVGEHDGGEAAISRHGPGDVYRSLRAGTNSKAGLWREAATGGT